MGISLKDMAAMQNRLSGKEPGARPDLQATSTGRPISGQVVLGLDPSLRGTGYGVIQMARPHPRCLSHGTIKIPSGWVHSRCLVKIVQELRKVIRNHAPTVCVCEGLFYAQNIRTALVMGEARGAALSAVAEAGLEIFEMAPRKMKQAIVGYGAAQKEAVAKMVQRMLHLAELPAPDAADALGLALAHLQSRGGVAGLNSLKPI